MEKSGKIIDTIKADLYRYNPEKFSLGSVLKGLRSKGFRYILFFRLYNKKNTNLILKSIFKIFLRRYSNKYGFQIGGSIGKGFYIGHFGHIVVSNFAKIGENCNISPGVTIGTTRRGPKKGVPKIGDRVWIGTNAVIVGQIEIGNNVLIAPGSYVNQDIPSDSIVLGNPAIIKRSANATYGYINNTV